MIIIYLKGGLGNQLFQYALGRHLAHIHQTELKMDISAYDYDQEQPDAFCGLRKYALTAFNIRQNFATEDEIKRLTEINASRFYKLVHHLFHSHPPTPKTFVRYNKQGFNPKILKLPNNVYLEGYWQSEKYFIDIEDIIRDEFTPKTPQAGRDKELAETMSSCESVAISVRRGDFVTNPKTSKTHGACSQEYYHKCVDLISEKIKTPVFFVFSDDIQWCKDNIKLDHETHFIDHNGPNKVHENLRLMSQCKHDIISNSSFSWWGAWLNKNSDKIVLAPQNWQARNDKKNIDILPNSWTKIPSD